MLEPIRPRLIMNLPSKTIRKIVKKIPIFNHDSYKNILQKFDSSEYPDVQFHVYLQTDEDGDCYASCELECYEESENPDYEKEMALYKYRSEKYDKEMEEYNKLILEYVKYCRIKKEEEKKFLKNLG